LDYWLQHGAIVQYARIGDRTRQRATVTEQMAQLSV